MNHSRGMQCYTVEIVPKGQPDEGLRVVDSIVFDRDPLSPTGASLTLGKVGVGSTATRVDVDRELSAAGNYVCWALVAPHGSGHVILDGTDYAIEKRYGKDTEGVRKPDGRLLVLVRINGEFGNTVRDTKLANDQCVLVGQEITGRDNVFESAEKRMGIERALCQRCEEQLQWLSGGAENHWYHGPVFNQMNPNLAARFTGFSPALPNALDELPGVMFLAVGRWNAPGGGINTEFLCILEPGTPGLHIRRDGKSHGDIERFPLDVVIRPDPRSGRLLAIPGHRLMQFNAVDEGPVEVL